MSNVSKLDVLVDIIDTYVGDVKPTDDPVINKEREGNLQLLIETTLFLNYILSVVADTKTNGDRSHDVIIHKAKTILQAIHESIEETESFPKKQQYDEHTYKFIIVWEDGTREELFFRQVNNTWTAADAILGKEDWIIKDCPTLMDVVDELISQDSFIDTIDIYGGPDFESLDLYYIKDMM